jgi:hypothetical protein
MNADRQTKLMCNQGYLDPNELVQCYFDISVVFLQDSKNYDFTKQFLKPGFSLIHPPANGPKSALWSPKIFNLKDFNTSF